MAKSSNVIFFLEKIQKFSRNTRSSFEPMDLIGMIDKYICATHKRTGERKNIYDLSDIRILENQFQKR